MDFFEMGGLVSAEEQFRFWTLGVKNVGSKQGDVDLWLNSDKHIEKATDIPKVAQEIMNEEAIEEAVAEAEREPW